MPECRGPAEPCASDLDWFRKPSADRPGTLNATYQLLDRAVIAGRGDEPVLYDETGPVSHAVLLAEAAELGGVLRVGGVSPGTPVELRIGTDRRAVTALLALARVGGVLAAGPDHAVARIDGSAIAGIPWGLLHEVGRGNPAPAEELVADAPWTAHLTVRELALALARVPVPVTAEELARQLLGPTMGG